MTQSRFSAVFRPIVRVALMSGIILGSAGCWERTNPDLAVRLDSGFLADEAVAASDSSGSLTPFRLAFASVLSPERSTVVYARLSTYLAERMGRPVEVIRRRTYAELNELLRAGAADAGLICTGAFAAGEDQFGLEALVVPVIGGQRTYRSYIITRRDAGLRSFDALRGASFAFTDPLSNTGYRYVAVKLRGGGTDPDRFFARVLFTYSHDNSILAVRDGVVDGASVDSIVWDELVRRDPSLEREVVVVERSEEFPINPLAVPGNMGPELRALLRDAFLTMDEVPEGREILEELGTDRFEDPTAAELEGYRAIARSWRELAGRTPGATNGTR